MYILPVIYKNLHVAGEAERSNPQPEIPRVAVGDAARTLLYWLQLLPGNNSLSAYLQRAIVLNYLPFSIHFIDGGNGGETSAAEMIEEGILFPLMDGSWSALIWNNKHLPIQNKCILVKVLFN